MAERIIEHPLRTIRLVYDDNRPETEADSELFKRYVSLHDSLLDLRRQLAKLRFDYMELEPEVDSVVRSFHSISENISALIHETDVLVNKVKRDDAIHELRERMNNCTEDIQRFHNGELLPLSEQFDVLQVSSEAYYAASDALEEILETYDNEVERPFYANYDAYATDLNQYDGDMDEFKGIWEAMEGRDEPDQVLGKFNRLVNEVNAIYAQWRFASESISRFFDGGDLLSRAVSEATAKGELRKEQQPLYLIPPNDPIVSDFPGRYGLMADLANNTLSIAIPKEAVLSGDVFMIQEIVLALQHYPGMLEKMLFSIDFSFQTEFGTDMDEDQWKGMEVPVRWVHSLSTFPCLYFFLKDHDARSYFLMGDMVFDGILTPSPEGDLVKVEGEALETLANRVFNICVFFMLFCHNTGFDPSATIRQTLIDIDLPIPFDDIRSEYEQQIRDGVEIRVLSQQKGK